MRTDRYNRRRFLHTTAALAATPFCAFGAEPSFPLKGSLLKTLKIGMVKGTGTLTEKFKVAKDAGFDGIEMNAPGIDIGETKRATVESGLPVDGSVNSGPWNVRHTDPDAAIRAKALEALKDGLRQTKAVGGHTLLLVVGHRKNRPEKEI